MRTQIILYEVPMFVRKYVFSILLNTTEHMMCNVKYKFVSYKYYEFRVRQNV